MGVPPNNDTGSGVGRGCGEEPWGLGTWGKSDLGQRVVPGW